MAVSSNEVPLCVDLDGTLVKSDTLHESIMSIVRRRPFALLAMPLWLLRGRAFLKHKVSSVALLDAALLPYNQDFLSYIRSCREDGRRLVLVTAANPAIAHAVSHHLGIFDTVLASSETLNLKGKNKRALLEDQFGAGQFDYAGNSQADIPVWQVTREAILVQTPRWIARLLQAQKIHIAHDFRRSLHPVVALLRACRLHQWVKNALIFAPVLLAHQLLNVEKVAQTAVGFLAFSLLASGVYLTNDLFDIQNDREHPLKKHRPLAAGDLPIWVAVIAIVILLAAVALLSSLLPPAFSWVAAIYLALTFAYSAYLKKQLVLDVVILALLYGMRILAGGAVAEVTISPWLLGFSTFFFFSLALVKRTSELQLLLRSGPSSQRTARGYITEDLDYLPTMGISAGCVSTLVLALYIQGRDVLTLYSHPEWLWPVCLVVLYWMSRIWLITMRGHIIEDPILFAVRDRMSYFAFTSVAVALYLAL